MDRPDAVRRHYEAAIADEGALLERLDAILDNMKPPITAAKLAGIDQFHLGGLAATAELAKRAGITSAMNVLDAGSGLGGPSRFLADSCGCRVVGIDLSPNYVAIANLLTGRVGLGAQVAYQVGNLTKLPFGDAAFDCVWTQHVVMNIADRAGLYGEFRRVLKQGGTLAFFDPIAADGAPEPYFPVPWAATPDLSTLLTAQATTAALAAAGFAVVSLDDVTATAMEWGAQQRAAPGGAMNLANIVGERMGEMVANFGRNLKEGRVRLAMGIFRAT